MKHQEVVRSALHDKSPVYVLVRNDGFILDEAPYVVKLHTQQEVNERMPVGPHWAWTQVDPFDPTEGFHMDDRGSFWLNGFPYEGRCYT